MAPRAPHLGLSKNMRPPSLLQTVNGQKINRSAKASVPTDPLKHRSAKSSPTLPDSKPLGDDEDIYRLPADLDSDEEDATDAFNASDLCRTSLSRESIGRKGIDTSDLPKLNIDIRYSSDEEDTKTADIRPTTFQTGSRRSKRYDSNSTSREKTEDDLGSIRESTELLNRRRTRRGSSPKEASKRSRRTIASGSTETETTDSKLGSHLADDFGLPMVGKLRRLHGSQSKRKYGSFHSIKSSPERSFKQPPADPKNNHTPQKPFFKKPDIDISPSPMSSQESPRKFQVPIGISPSKSGSTQCQSPGANCSIGDDNLPDLAINFSPELSLRKKKLLEDIETGSPSPAFTLPNIVRDILMDTSVDFDAINGSLNAGSADAQSLSFDDVVSPRSPEAAPVTCPMCGECVDAEFLRSYNNGEWMNTRMQARFCQAHKRADAQNDWHAHGYPIIDWSKLDARIEKHHGQLKALLDGASSYYRNVLDANVKAGERTLAQSLRKDRQLLPGYYGSRGLKVLSENIMRKFSPMLRRIAIQDRLVSSRGVAGYVQAVLVPELAVLLICEDMDVGVEKGRSIMMDSAAAGDLVNEEEGDVLVRRDDDSENDNWGD